MSLRDFLAEKSSTESADSLLEFVEDWYHVPAVALLFVFMLWVRTRSYSNFIRDGEIYFRGNDPWYHFRETTYVLQHWPFTMPYDPWTNFPYGTNAEQFGTLYDQLAATLIIVLRPLLGGDVAGQVMLVFAPLLGSLTVVPIYFIGRRFGGRIGGVFGALVFALLPGTMLGVTLVGFFDHQAGEVLFQAIAVLAIVVALDVADTEKPVWELVEDRDLDGLRTPLTYAALAGVATALYMWVWPPGILLVGLAGVYFVVAITADVVQGETPEPTAFVGTVAMGVAGVLMLVPLTRLSFGVTSFSLLQVVLPLGVAVGSAFLAAMARRWEHRGLDPSVYPVGVFGLIGVGLAAFAVVVPDAFNLIASNLLRTVGFSAGAETRTIGEAQPFLAGVAGSGTTALGKIMLEYGMALFAGIVAAAWLVAKPLVFGSDARKIAYAGASLGVITVIFVFPFIHRAIANALGVHDQVLALGVVSALIVGGVLQHRHDPDELFILVWAAFITGAAFTQTRFNYYLAGVVAVMNAYLLKEALAWLDLRRSLRTITDDLGAWQAIVLVLVVAVVLVPVLVVPVDVGTAGVTARTNTAVTVGDSTGPGGVTQWDGSLQWMQEETPYPGEYGGHANAMEYYGTYEWPADSDFDYPAGAYGIQSWWDYGHWITTRAHRIPNANPFQQGATEAANYLLATSEDAAEAVLEDRSETTSSATTRYVMVDWQMVTPGSKFGAPTVFKEDVSQADFVSPVYFQQGQGQGAGYQFGFYLKSENYYRSQMVRLYHYHGSAVDPQPIVVDWEPIAGVDPQFKQIQVGEGATSVRGFQNMTAARAFVEREGTAQIGGVGAFPPSSVPALQHYRLVKASRSSALQSSSYLRQAQRTIQVTGVRQLHWSSPAWVKTFERVPGATVEGQGPANATIRANVTMYSPSMNESFQYYQFAETGADGSFTMTLPYSTTGYGEWGPANGHTNVSVRARGPYTFRGPTTVNGTGVIVTYDASTDVSEAAVIGERDEPVRVTLEERPVQNLPEGMTANTVTVQNNSSSRAIAPELDPVRDDAGSTAVSAP